MRYDVTVQLHKDYVRVEENHIFVGLRSKPEGGKANVELINKVAKYFGVSSLNVRIVAGHKSRHKIVEVI